MCLADKASIKKSLDWLFPVYFIIWKNIKEVIYSGQNNSVKTQLVQSTKTFMTKMTLPENDYIPLGKTVSFNYYLIKAFLHSPKDFT